MLPVLDRLNSKREAVGAGPGAAGAHSQIEHCLEAIGLEVHRVRAGVRAPGAGERGPSGECHVGGPARV